MAGKPETHYLRPLMKLLIKQARAIDPSSPFHGQTIDIIIENGSIVKIGSELKSKSDQTIESKDLCVSPGWVDVFANFADPGYEYKETLLSGSAAAAIGGYTDVMVLPNTKPSIDNKGQVEYILQRARITPVTIHPIGAITKNLEGKELAEMYDMQASGAVAFSDGINCVQSAGLLTKALQYVKTFDGVIIQMPDDKSINPHGLMNEGIVSTRLGLAGKPSMGEELIVARDIKLAEYTGSRIHFTGVASKKALEYIKAARKSGIHITCSVTPYHLFFCDEDIAEYDANLKVNPPLRTREDREALRQGVIDGTIDCIATHHLPHETDSKLTEFEYAKFGMIGLESSYGVLRTALPSVTQEQWVSLLSLNARKIFGLPVPVINENVTATLTLFDPVRKWTFSEQNIRSKSRNTPFIGKELNGKAIGIINKKELFLNP